MDYIILDWIITMGRSNNRPYRSSSRSIPRLRTGSDRRKVVYFEYGTEHNYATGRTDLYVDIINGNPDLVDFVSFRFHPSGETHIVRKRTTVILSDGIKVPRFTIKQSSVHHWSRKVTVVVFGRGGSRRVRQLRAKPGNFRERPLKFLETRSLREHYCEAPDFRFGLEIETSLGSHTTAQDVVRRIARMAGVEVIDKTEDYKRGSEDNYSKWLLVPDASTMCSRTDPYCNKFELVSRILRGGDGLEECKQVLEALESVGRISINKSMGLHVHVNTSGLSLEHLKNVCLNFVKHESAIDSIMPESRISSPYCLSNREAIPGGDGLKHNAIVSCDNIVDVCHTVNPSNRMGERRYYKLNLQNLNPTQKGNKKQSKPTIEFRQHSSTTKFDKIEAWVRFCTSLVQNSVERPQKLKGHEDVFESLFDTVIQDLRLKEFYRNRRAQLRAKRHHHDHEEGDTCCGPCLKGGTCER